MAEGLDRDLFKSKARIAPHYDSEKGLLKLLGVTYRQMLLKFVHVNPIPSQENLQKIQTNTRGLIWFITQLDMPANLPDDERTLIIKQRRVQVNELMETHSKKMDAIQETLKLHAEDLAKNGFQKDIKNFQWVDFEKTTLYSYLQTKLDSEDEAVQYNAWITFLKFANDFDRGIMWKFLRNFQTDLGYRLKAAFAKSEYYNSNKKEFLRIAKNKSQEDLEIYFYELVDQWIVTPEGAKMLPIANILTEVGDEICDLST